MHSFRQQSMKFFTILFLFICIVHSSQVNTEEQHANKKPHDHDQTLDINRFHMLKPISNRRGLYDPAFGDSWSNYLEKKRNLFDPAYGDWANRFKRSHE